MVCQFGVVSLKYELTEADRVLQNILPDVYFELVVPSQPLTHIEQCKKNIDG